MSRLEVDMGVLGTGGDIIAAIFIMILRHVTSGLAHACNLDLLT